MRAWVRLLQRGTCSLTWEAVDWQTGRQQHSVSDSESPLVLDVGRE